MLMMLEFDNFYSGILVILSQKILEKCPAVCVRIVRRFIGYSILGRRTMMEVKDSPWMMLRKAELEG